MILKVGCRPSPLARIQAAEALEHLRKLGLGFEAEIVSINSSGDTDKLTPLSRVEGSDFFTRQIEAALLCGEIDLAVHSAKDLEDDPLAELETVLLTPVISPHECLVSRNGATLAALRVGSVVGTSSRKRSLAVQAYRPDLVIKDIRGTIQERLARLDRGEYDALIMAHAALIRLGLADRAAEILPAEVIPPHPLQGRLAVQVRRADERFEIIRSRTTMASGKQG
jgi:hydroxymethylbilane synthase